MCQFHEDEAKGFGAECIISRAVSPGTKIRAPSNFTHPKPPEKIGEDRKATIHERPGSNSVYKKEKLDSSGLGSNLLAEYGIHDKVQQA